MALLLLLALFAYVSALPLTLQPRQSCANGVHIIVARASTEQQGEGIIGQVATSIKNQIRGSDSVAVVYPATLNNYQNSKDQGVRAMTGLVQNYVRQCPNSRIVLMGYSQGAHVVGDTLVGSSGSGSGLSDQYSRNIIAAIQMGDPTFVPNQSFDVGTSTRRGIFPRSNVASYTSKGYASRMQSYCDSGDQYCASGNSLQVHLSYVRNYGGRAASFVVQRANIQ